MISKIIYYPRIVAFILYLILTIFLLPTIFKSGRVGIFFLVTLFLFIAMTLFSMLSKKEIYLKTKSYNLIIIALAIYVCIVCYRVNLDTKLISTGLYIINMKYSKINFILLGLVMIGITLNTIVLYLADESGEEIK